MYGRIGLDPGKVGYVEAHGTGTVAGDTAEIESISDVFCAGIKRDVPLYVGSIKTNIGHLEAASGIAGLIKTVLILENGLIPPNPNLEKIKKNLDIENRQMKIPRSLEPWPANVSNRPRYAAVNSYCYGGTNAHYILESTIQGVFQNRAKTLLSDTLY
ncbi:hypothetical protein ABVK25_012534 [Lepraria finkii]|uniref:Ketosynthase family 3 (KS3) domain-containing protein n=1 Tax=Lepraria finkii TaxID=1340010 RepID=A0ABR4AFT7_9LECA